jgi:hypothetical protein
MPTVTESGQEGVLKRLYGLGNIGSIPAKLVRVSILVSGGGGGGLDILERLALIEVFMVVIKWELTLYTFRDNPSKSCVIETLLNFM